MVIYYLAAPRTNPAGYPFVRGGDLGSLLRDKRRDGLGRDEHRNPRRVKSPCWRGNGWRWRVGTTPGH